MPAKFELGKRIVSASENTIFGFKIHDTNVRIICSGTETGGNLVIARKTLDPKHKYDYEKTVVNQGEEIIKDIEYRSVDGQEKTIIAKITGI